MDAEYIKKKFKKFLVKKQVQSEYEILIRDYEMLYGETYGVSISSQIGEGTRVFIRIPIKGGFMIDL